MMLIRLANVKYYFLIIVGKNIKFDPKEGKIKLTYEQFMEVMATNIINNRKKYGKEKIKFESETNSTMCFVCSFNFADKENEFCQPL